MPIKKKAVDDEWRRKSRDEHKKNDQIWDATLTFLFSNIYDFNGLFNFAILN